MKELSHNRQNRADCSDLQGYGRITADDGEMLGDEVGPRSVQNELVGTRGQTAASVRLRATARATIAASSPTPSSSDDLRLRRKWTPTKYRPSTTVLAPSNWIGKPSSSNARGQRTQAA